ncbi:MAG: ABC transporter permease subunit [Chloroflexota bacterium]
MMDKVWAVVRKEWAEVFKNRFVLFTVSFLPLLFTVIPLITLYTTGTSGEMGGVSLEDLPPGMSALCGGLDGVACAQYAIISQFFTLFMMVPVIIPITIASYSIVGEKTTNTLEPLLATPITTMELLAAKELAAAIPAILATWGSYLLYAIGARILAERPEVVAKMFDPFWLLAIFAVGPLLAIAGVCIAIMVSSRVNDPRVAEQISAIFVLPLIGLFIAQTSGVILINEKIIMWMAAGLVVVDTGLLCFATQLFQRETILTRWK